MKRCPKCRNFMPPDEARCIRCGTELAPATRGELIRPAEVVPIADFQARTLRRSGWARVLAAVLTSKLFFLATCTAGTLVGLKLHDDLFLEAGGHRGADRRMMVVAMAADPRAGGKTVAHQIRYADLDSFKAIYPDCSFLLPPGSGRVDNQAAGISTNYTVQPAGAGKVLVETRFNHEMLDVFSRYEATEKEIRPLFFKTGMIFVFALTFGFAIACVFGLAGLLFQYFVP